MLALIGLFLVMIAGVGGMVMIANARDAVRAEMASALELGTVLGRAELVRATGPDGIAALNRLGLRHLRFTVAGSREEPAAPAGTASAPDWFTALIGASPQERRLDGAGGLVLRVVAEPWDEVAEVWEDMSDLALAVLVTGALLLASAPLAVGRALAPLSRFETGLERLSVGRYDFTFDGAGVPELKRLGRGIAALAAKLSAAKHENRRLGQRLVEVQDGERREIAREIHDELGAALFAVKVDAGRILRLSEGPTGAVGAAGTASEVAERARSILATAADVHRMSRRILVRLRPALLDQLPLSEALAELVGDWARRQPDIGWTLDIGPDVAAELDGCDEVLRLTAYRLVQESLVNALRHATPSRVEVRVAVLAGRMEISIADDGPGHAAGTGVRDSGGPGMPSPVMSSPAISTPAVPGFGISGMAERVQALGGALIIAGADGGTAAGMGAGGTRVTARLPLPQASAAQAEQVA
nr:histidine kinase [Azospirillum picis]